MNLLFPEREVVRVLLDGRLVDAVFRVEAGEHARRARFGLRALCYPHLLRRLERLPSGVLVGDPVPWVETCPLPEGVVERSAAGIGRLLEPPVVLDAVVVPAVGPAQTRHVWVADRFAPHARRWVVSGDRRVDAAVLVAAAVRGVGLVTRWPGPEVVTAADSPAGRPTAGTAWLLAEQTYGAWLAAGARSRRRELVPTG
ncbi:hypothetical protein I6A81_04560 [Frankia sp. CN7]|nr:hypothetical protein [Frankia nepalensis]